MDIKATEIKLVDISQIIPNPRNRNKHSDDQIKRLCEIIKYQGFRSPLIISNQSNYLVVGHGRLMAARVLGLNKLPCVYQDFLDLDMEYAYMVADNAIASWAELDIPTIKLEIPTMSFSIEQLGIKDFAIDPVKETGDPDEVPEVTEPIAKLGELYLLGDHRLMCGDSTDSETVDKLMNGEKADITFTSPPYNLGDNAKLRGYNGDGKDSAYKERSDHKSESEYLDFLIKWTQLAIENSVNVFSNIQILAGNKFIMSDYWGHFKNNLVDLMVWDKVHAAPQMAARVLNSVWEFIFIFTDEVNPKRSIKTGPEFRGNIPNIYRLNPVGKKDELAKDHRAVFPVEFAQYFVEHFSKKSVLDLFGGSGSTLIACEKTNRRCFMSELDPHYVDVIIQRWMKYSGKTAYLIENSSGKLKDPVPYVKLDSLQKENT